MKVKDLLTMDIDIDVVDDVCEELWIAFCGPLRLTPAGKKHFREVLAYDIELRTGSLWGPLVIVNIDDPDDSVWKKRLRKAKEFFYGCAGYVDSDAYDKWFIAE